MAAKVRLRVLRGIMKELKGLYGSKGSTRTIFGYSFLMSEYRNSMSVDEEIAGNLNRDAVNFLSMLTNERKKQELYTYYKGAGEISIDKIAQRVGFKLPKTLSTSEEHDSSKT